MDTPKPKTVDDYIAAAPLQTKEQLEWLRIAISQAAPDAVESIYYDMPVYRLNGILVYIAGFPKHVSLYAGSDAIAAFKEELTPYKTAGGTIRFPLHLPIPATLVQKIITYRIQQNNR